MQRFLDSIVNTFRRLIASFSNAAHVLHRGPRIAMIAIGMATLVLTSVPASAQTVVYVHMNRPWDDQNLGNNTVDGTSWATAFRFLQDALDWAANNNPGTTTYHLWLSGADPDPQIEDTVYRPDQRAANESDAECEPYGDCDTEKYFNLSPFINISLYGGFPHDAHDEQVWDVGGAVFADREPETYLTILSGDIDDDDVVLEDEEVFLEFTNYSDNSERVVFSSSFGDQAILLDGLTVCGGSTYGGVNVEGFGDERVGNVSLNVVECFIHENRYTQVLPGGDTPYGGGIRFAADIDGDVLLDVRHTTLKYNQAGCGGGAYAVGGIARFIDVRAIKNKAVGGGGIATALADVTILNADVSSNFSSHSTGGGGANIHLDGHTALIHNSLISQNETNTLSFSTDGGGLHVTGSGTVDIRNCTIADNRAGGDGKDVYLSNSNVCASISNTIIWGSVTPVLVESGCQSFSVTYSNVRTSTGNPLSGTGNIEDDPLFVGSGITPYALRAAPRHQHLALHRHRQH